MADYETTLRWLSERGNPVGAEELIERVRADLAGDPLVVLPTRREGRPMTKTSQPPTTKQPIRPRGPVVGVAAFAIILALFGIYYFAARAEDDNVAEPVPPTGSGADRATIEAGVAAVYSGDADRAAELFELDSSPYGNDHVLTDQQIRAVAIYQKAIGGRLSLNCTELQTPGEFTCRVPYHNTLTDAVGYKDPGDANRVVVKDGVITSFGFPEHSGLLLSMAAYLALESGGEVPEECHHLFGPFTENCVAIQRENLDGWAAFYKTDWSGMSQGLMDQLGESSNSEWETLTTWALEQG